MLHNDFEYLTDDVMKEFIDECFIKDIIFVENSVYDNFYDEVRENNHDTITNNNSNNACIIKNVNDVENSMRHDKITIHSNSNFDSITGAKSLPLMKRTELIALAKSPFSNDLIKECKYFLEKVQKFNSNIEKTNFSKHMKMVSGTAVIIRASILSGLREHKMYHRRSLKVGYFPSARIADMKHYSVPLLVKQPQRIIQHIGTNDVSFLTPENKFDELKELRGFILKFLPDVKLIFSIPVIRTNENNKQFINCLKKAKFHCIHHMNITEDHLNAYGLHINAYGARVLAKNRISGAHAM